MEFDRRQILAALTAPILLSAAAKAALSTPGSLVITKYGPIEGRFFDGAHEFKGIPYGASTAVTRRFMPPSAPTPWRTLLATLDDGPASPQSRPGKVALIPESEDCLKLNVWTPALRDGEKRPVMVWLHGGGLTDRVCIPAAGQYHQAGGGRWVDASTWTLPDEACAAR